MKPNVITSIRRDKTDTLLEKIKLNQPYTDDEWLMIVTALINRLSKAKSRISLRNRQIRDMRRSYTDRR